MNTVGPFPSQVRVEKVLSVDKDGGETNQRLQLSSWPALGREKGSKRKGPEMSPGISKASPGKVTANAALSRLSR